MSNQKTREADSPDISAATSTSSTTTSQEPKRPVVVARPASRTQPVGAADEAAGGASRKAPSKRPVGKKIRKRGVQDSGASPDPRDVRQARVRQARHRPRFSRKQIIIGLIIFVLIFDVMIVTIGYFGRGGPKVPPNPDSIALIESQMSNNRNIPRIGYDSALTFANYPDLSIVNTASLKPIENNLLRSGGGPNGEDSLYDEQIVGRVLKFNSDWYDYLNKDSQAVFESVQDNSPAQTKVAELDAGWLIAYHQLAIGEIRRTGKNYYLITRASYTLTKDGQLEIHDDVFVYKLVTQLNTVLIVDFEQIPVNATPETATETATEPTEQSGEPQPTGPVDGTGEGEATGEPTDEGAGEGVEGGAGDPGATEEPVPAEESGGSEPEQ